MNRQLAWVGSIPQDTDILLTNRHAMAGLGLLALDVLGPSTLAFGLGCTPTAPASLNVSIAPGRLYSLQNVDNTAYGSLAADTTHQILKQGILADAATLGCPAPGTFGFSINYLIEAAYADQDTNLVVLPYYNSANPNVPFSGQNNNGVAQATQRKSIVSLTVKAGTAAATGTQTTPAVDSGNVGLWVVTVANGQTSITSANITPYPSAPFNSGTFTATLTGCTTAPTTPVKWVRNGSLVTAIITPVSATSNSTTCTLTGMPSILAPSSQQTFGVAALYNSGVVNAAGGIQVDAAGLITLIMNATSTGFASSGLKGIPNPISITWATGI